MNLDDCRCFLKLAETLHFSRAAAELHMSASALSRLVQRLESGLGQLLLVRDRRHVSLTRAGELVVEHARRQLTEHALLVERLAQEAGTPSGVIRIACTVTACYSVLADVLSRCRSRYPGIHLQLLTSDAVRASARLRDGETDVAVLPLPDRIEPGVRVWPLAKTALRIVTTKQDPLLSGLGPGQRVPTSRLGEVPLILPKQGLEREHLDAFLREHKLSPNVYAEVSGNEAILAMVSLGCGWGCVPELVLKGSPLKDALVAIPLRKGPAGYAVGACALPRTLERRVVSLFWQLLELAVPTEQGAAELA